MTLLNRAVEKFRTDGLLPFLESTREYGPSELWGVVRKYMADFSNQSIVENRGVAIPHDATVFTQTERRELFRNRFGPREDWVNVIADHIARQNLDLLEFGAGVGFMSCRVNSAMADGLKHVAVEANPRVADVLERVAQINDCPIEVSNTAYAFEEETVQFRLYDKYREGSRFEGRGNISDAFSVPATNLGYLIAEHDLESFVLYSNMEGAEFELLDAEFELIEQHCPLLVISYHNFTEHDPEAYHAAVLESFNPVWDNGAGTYIYENQRTA